MNQEIIQEGKFNYLETKGGSETLILLHGLFGALSNFGGIINHFSQKLNVVVPILPIFDLPIRKVSVKGLVDYLAEFVEHKKFSKVNILGNSLGGHIALLFSLGFSEKVRSITLTGSSGLFESGMGNSFPKRGDYEYIRKKTEATFYDPIIASKELVDEIFSAVNDRNKAFRIIATAKSAIRHNLGDKLYQLKAPTLLIWGKQDEVTPPFVGEKFNELIENSKLIFVDKCGHAPMMEHPDIFNKHLDEFLSDISAKEESASENHDLSSSV
ncbi:MAG: alpha/beta hydrolase [Bacteroidetes bacterium]|nr:alpha/beta hydrolase [Bacteroidota bacterium]